MQLLFLSLCILYLSKHGKSNQVIKPNITPLEHRYFCHIASLLLHELRVLMYRSHVQNTRDPLFVAQSRPRYWNRCGDSISTSPKVGSARPKLKTRHSPRHLSPSNKSEPRLHFAYLEAHLPSCGTNLTYLPFFSQDHNTYLFPSHLPRNFPVASHLLFRV
jgi:hypothetical protein